MEMELEPRVKPLSYKVKAASRESPSQKALHVLDTDLRNHWSTGTNTKEWILLELDEPCLLAHIRIYNKSVLEWEIAVGLRYKPETFTKVRSRCEAPRRDMMYQTNYTPCRYVRISCLRGNPIAIFFIQLNGVPVAGLEPAFQPVVNHLLPQIIAHKQDADDMHLKLLQNITNKLLVFLPQLEADLISFSDSPESNLRFLAMLSGPFYPILHVVNERESTKSASNVLESEVSKTNQTSSALTVSSNFAPRRSRNTSSLLLTSGIVAFRPDVVFVLLRKAYEDSSLRIICRAACRILQKFIEPYVGQETSTSFSNETSEVDEAAKPVSESPFSSADYSSLFGEDFRMPEEHWDSSYLNILDISAVEEGILHVLYACASQPLLCGKLAENSTEMWSALPLIQALLPALRPLANSYDNIDESFLPWKQPYIQQALSQIVMTTSSSLYHPLLHAAAGYLSSYSQSHVKAACLLIDLCSHILAPWMPQVIAKVDLAVELLEELQATIQNAHHTLAHARAAIKYILLALSGHMDDILGKYKEVKQGILFLLEMLEPFLDPAITTFKSTIAFGDVCSNFLEKQEYNCEIALNIIRIAVRKPAVLPYLESEWRSGLVAPSVLLSILEPHLQLPPEIDRCKPPVSNNSSAESSQQAPAAFRTNGQDDHDVRTDMADAVAKGEFCEDVSIFFSPSELRSSPLTNVSSIPDENASNASSADINSEHKRTSKSQLEKNVVVDTDFAAEYFNLQMDYFQLANFRDSELRAAEFQRLASDLQLQPQITPEGHDASIDALLLAAECYVNPYFMKSSRSNLKDIEDVTRVKIPGYTGTSEFRALSNIGNMDAIAHLETKRDKIVLQLLIKAAELDRNYWERKISDDVDHGEDAVVFDRHILNLSSLDIQSADAITLVRQNQALLCNFLIRQLQKGQHSMHEILMQSLLFLLTSATWLSCNPGDVVDIILHSAEYLHELITSLSYNMKDNMQSSSERKHGVQRRWMLIQKLVIASSGDDEGSDFKINVSDGLRYVNLVPPSAWIERIPVFSVSASPLVRFVGWMAVSRNAKQYIRDRLFLASELSELTNLLFIFADDLSIREKILSQKEVDLNINNSGVKQDSLAGQGLEIADQQYGYQSFDVIYPDIARFFPSMKKQFESLGDTILQAVGLQLRSIPSSMSSDILCWFSDLCSWPFPPKGLSDSPISVNNAKGYMAKNAKAVILYVLEAIVIEHMEAMVPEIPRLVHVLTSLCRASHCDVAFLGSVLQLLKPIISYSLKKVAEEDLLTDDSCLNFESLCFNELFNAIRVKGDNQLDSPAELYRKPLIIFILASVFSNLSFPRKRELLHSLLFLADFTLSEQTSLYHDYLCAYQCAMGSFKVLMLQILRMLSIIPLQSSAYSGSDAPLFLDSTSKSDSWFLCDILSTEQPEDASKGLEYYHDLESIPNEKANHLSADETKVLIEDLENLINKFNPTMEKCWMLHPQLTKKLVILSAECFVYIRCISSVLHNVGNTSNGEDAESPKSDKTSNPLSVHWQTGLQGLGENMLALLGSHCWIVSSIMLDCLLAAPHCLTKSINSSTICSAIVGFSCSAPKISWRLRADKWLSQLFARGICGFHEPEVPLVELFCTLLGHDEPEQRLIALKHLGKVVGQDVAGEQVLEFSESCNKLLSPDFASKIPEPILSSLVNGTWDNMTVMASSDSSFLLRTRAMTILVDFIPLANRHHLQSFLASADTLLLGLGNFAPPIFEGPYLQLSVALIAGCCLYLPKEDISLIPEHLWNVIESLGSSKPENEVRDVGKKICNALCRLRDEGNEQKEVLRFALSSSNWNHSDPHFLGTREAILQVLANLTAAESYFDAFSGEFDEALEQEEAEIELEIIQNEHASGEQFTSLKASGRTGSSGHLAAPVKDTNRLEQIKNCIQSIEKSRLREEVAARRQKVLLMRHKRKQFLEDVAVRETELLHELDRERSVEVEKEIERQHQLEIERAKTRELRHSLEMERERQTQRELQRELEHYESGIRSSRREFPSAGPPSRSRERYRERENGRSVHEGTARSSSGNLQPDAYTSSSMTMAPTVVLSGSRSYTNQPPTILQSRDRSDDCGSNYEENFDGSKDSGDTSSVGDPDLVSVFDGQSSLYGSGQRHGSRGSKSRQAAERRERDGRREGKWERKH